MSATEHTADFARRVRDRERVVGYWAVMDAPVATERLARTGYDYVCLDAQHGLFGYHGVRDGMMAIDAAAGLTDTPAVGMVRVAANEPAGIGQALDAGARGVVVPLVDTADDARAAVLASRYPPLGRRSYGPMRSQLRIGPKPADADAAVVVLAMIETPLGLENVEEIAAVPGIDGLYIGPSDLTLAVGGSHPADPDAQEALEAAAVRVKAACEARGIAAGIHTPSGAVAARRFAEGFTLVTVASDLVHLDQAATAHLAAARGE